MGKKLSETQAAFMERLKVAGSAGERCPFRGGRSAGRIASGWYRTAFSLKAKGLVRMKRDGDSWRAFLPVSEEME